MFPRHLLVLHNSLLFRIAAGFGLIVLLIALSTLMTAQSSRDTTASIDQLTNSANPILLTTGALDLELSQLSELFQLHQARESAAELPQIKEDFQSTRARIGEHSQQLQRYLDELGDTEAQVAVSDRFTQQVNHLADRMQELMAGHETSISRIAQIRERRQVIQSLEDDISELFEGLVWSLPDDESLAIALEFYASFLHGFMVIRDISIEEDPDALGGLVFNFDNWVSNHNNQFFSFTSMVAVQPGTQELVQTVTGLTDDIVNNTKGTDDMPGLAPLRQQVVEGAAHYRVELAELTEEVEVAKSALNALNEFAVQFAQDTNDQVATSLARAQWLSVASLGVSIFLAVIISLLIIRSIRHPIRELTRALHSLQQGDLTDSISTNRQDEMGVLARSVEEVRGALLKMLQSIRGQVDQLSAQADRSRQLATQSQAKTAEQSGETENIASSMQEMAASVAEVDGNTQAGMRHIREAMTEIDETVRVVEKNQASLEKLQSRIVEAESFSGELSGRMKEIESVSKMIGDIAEQTNLLALNAAIESARAGEHGRGFAVVADEVRTLASRTQRSTEEIRSIIESLLSGHVELSDTMRNILESVTASHQVATDTEEKMQAFCKRLDEINTVSEQTSATTEQQATTADEIARRVTRVADIARSNEEMALEAQEASEALGQVTADLESLVQRFKIG